MLDTSEDWEFEDSDKWGKMQYRENCTVVVIQGGGERSELKTNQKNKNKLLEIYQSSKGQLQNLITFKKGLNIQRIFIVPTKIDSMKIFTYSILMKKKNLNSQDEFNQSSAH